MFGGRLQLAGYTTLVVLVLFSVNCYAKKIQLCDPSYYSSCGNIHNITDPFRLKGDPENCGDKKYELECEEENNRTVLYLYSGKYYVEAINYNNHTIRVVDVGIQKNNCSSLPLHSQTLYPTTDPYYFSYSSGVVVAFMNCDNPVKSPLYLDMESNTTGSCSIKEEGRSFNSVKGGGHSYVVMGELKVSDVADLCTVEMVVMTAKPLPPGENGGNFTFLDVHNALVYGFELYWLSSRAGWPWYSFQCA